MKLRDILFCFLVIIITVNCNRKKNYAPIIIKPEDPSIKYYNNTPQENVQIYTNLQLSIDFNLYNHNNTFKKDDKIFLICEIKNIDIIEEMVYLKDHHDYHGTLDYPTSIFITIENEYGEKILNEYTDYFRWSTTFEEMPGDWILLKGSEEIIRIFSIEKIIGNENKKILNKGNYYVVIVLKYGDKKTGIRKKYYSNKLELKIIE
jgi:hypothetical protein